MIILTGASGWFGKNALYALEQRIGPERLRAELYPVASRSQLVDFGSPLGPIQCYSLTTLSKIESPRAVLHTAFLKRAKLEDLGHADFVRQNREITQSVIDLIKKNPSCPIVSISSGAAARCDEHLTSVEEDPYAVLKYEEELALSQQADQRTVFVFRVYAASGRFMTIPSIYALGEFVDSALRQQPIHIQAKHPVWRSYAHAGDLMALSWELLLNPSQPGYYKIDACTETLEIETLAKQVVECLGDGPVNREMDSRAKESCYAGNPDNLLALMQEKDIPIKSMKEQIFDTADGLQCLP